MTLRLILPVRPPREGKQRLAPVLGPEERHALNRAFFERTLAIASSVLPPAAIIVVSRAPEVLALAEARGVQPLLEQGDAGLNAALDQAAALLGKSDAALSLSIDLPLLDPSDLAAMISASADIILAPDRAGTGTNALCVAPVGAIPYCYGLGSAAAHREAATGLRFAVIDRPGLACDIDTPEDLAAHSEAIAALLEQGRSLVA